MDDPTTIEMPMPVELLARIGGHTFKLDELDPSKHYVLTREPETEVDELVKHFPAWFQKQLTVIEPHVKVTEKAEPEIGEIVANRLLPQEPPRLHPDDLNLILEQIRSLVSAAVPSAPNEAEPRPVVPTTPPTGLRAEVQRIDSEGLSEPPENIELRQPARPPASSAAPPRR